MPSDVSGIRGALSLSDDQFCEMLKTAAIAMRLPQASIDSIQANAPLIRAMLATASESDLQKLVQKLGKDQMNEILSKFSE